MVQPCEELWDWSWSCDVSNLQIMTIEIIIAAILAGIAIVAAVGFYFKEKSDRTESEKLIKKTTKTLDEIKPIIQKQGEEIKRLEKEAEIHRHDIISRIRTYFRYSKINLEEIEKAKKEPEVNQRIGTIKELTRAINDYLTAVERTIEDNRKIILPKEHLEIDKALAGVRMTRNMGETLNIRNYQNIEFSNIGEHIKTIDKVLEFLPDTDSDLI